MTTKGVSMRMLFGCSLFLATFAMLSLDSAERIRIDLPAALAQSAPPDPRLADVIGVFGTDGVACDSAGLCVTLNPRTQDPITIYTQLPTSADLWVCNPSYTCTPVTQAYICGPGICYCENQGDCLDLLLDCPESYTWACGEDPDDQCICTW
jgi:hypothetical protein